MSLLLSTTQPCMRNDKQNYACVFAEGYHLWCSPKAITNHQIAPPTTNHLIAEGDRWLVVATTKGVRRRRWRTPKVVAFGEPERSHGGDASCTKNARNKYIIQTPTFFKKPCYTRENLCFFCKVVEKSKGFFLNKTLGCLK